VIRQRISCMAAVTMSSGSRRRECTDTGWLPHGNCMRGSSRILEHGVEQCCKALSLGRCEVLLPMRGYPALETARQGFAASRPSKLALDRPTRRLGDGYKENWKRKVVRQLRDNKGGGVSFVDSAQPRSRASKSTTYSTRLCFSFRPAMRGLEPHTHLDSRWGPLGGVA
jgi:hypothetical protein